MYFFSGGSTFLCRKLPAGVWLNTVTVYLNYFFLGQTYGRKRGRKVIELIVQCFPTYV